MNADLYKRLFKAIFTEDTIALKKIAELIILSERNKKHTVLADSLEKIKSNEKPKANNGFAQYMNDKSSSGGMGTLPTSKRNNQQLVSYVPRNQLKHHMILNDEIENKLLCIEKEYFAKERLAKFNLAPKKKILLYGAPGCGKTLAAERLAWNLGLPLLKVRFDSLLSSYFGESASNLRAVFDYCKNEPVVLLLDECDFIAKSRTASQDVGEVPRIVNMLLTLLDEYSSPGLVVATTNLKVSLDEALFRRFDDIIEIPKPSSNEIKRLLKTTFSAMNVSRDIDWNLISKELEGHSAANVVSIAQNAAKSCVLEGSKMVKKEHILGVIREVSMKY
ncbi:MULTISPECIES: AAA family ATPase [Bacillus cereus group]|uniref:AAA family ATPase n=1 Tax=Bacillus cereus group TaxID=86661 RepID=UPI000941D745|nr:MULTISPECIES: ATP-binding protein [Bacillus cereus group]MCZ7522342.1 ATP-binding protein [Bacillus pacificus]MDA1575431.1 ATP-binding protein [Bacillus cereus group sp. TH242-3LC]MED1583772.1 ATP-binding protein [Bacillus pacificus]